MGALLKGYEGIQLWLIQNSLFHNTLSTCPVADIALLTEKCNNLSRHFSSLAAPLVHDIRNDVFEEVT